MASELFIKGKQLSGVVANALKINCKDKDGNQSTVQAELNKLNNEVSEQNKKIDNRNHKYTGTVSAINTLQVQHKLNIDGDYYPVVSALTGECVVYGVQDITPNSFTVLLVNITGYKFNNVAVGTQITINWCY